MHVYVYICMHVVCTHVFMPEYTHIYDTNIMNISIKRWPHSPVVAQ